MGRGAATTEEQAVPRNSALTLDELKRVLGDCSPEGWTDRMRLADRALRGKRVRLLSGTILVSSTSPSFQPGDALKRASTVTVRSALPARSGEYRDDPPYPAEITWAGAGGYWRTARLDDVEMILD